MSILYLANRSLVRMTGAETEALLQRLITTDLDEVKEDEAGYGALLTPQGKIVMDFLVTRLPDGFLFDLEEEIVTAFVRKMTLYRMRVDVVIEPLADRVGVSLEPVESGIRDPRSPLLGWRIYGTGEEWQADEGLKADYLSRHIEAAIPQAGLDFAFEEAFPHDINMDYLGGLHFDKGCYIGQEVVSRMKHRGTARRRIVRLDASQPLPPAGTGITAAGKPVGTVGATSGNKGLGLVRIDRVSDAVGEGTPLLAEEVSIIATSPDYADFFPER